MRVETAISSNRNAKNQRNRAVGYRILLCFHIITLMLGCGTNQPEKSAVLAALIGALLDQFFSEQ